MESGKEEPGMATAGVACPYCGQAIEPPPRRNRKCPHCGRWVFLRDGRPMTEADAKALDARKAADAEVRAGQAKATQDQQVRDLVAEEVRRQQDREDAPRVARFKHFQGGLSPLESLFERAAEFASELGPARVISITHAEGQSGSVVTVWYWTDADLSPPQPLP
jgi:hypothetical protein